MTLPKTQWLKTAGQGAADLSGDSSPRGALRSLVGWGIPQHRDAVLAAGSQLKHTEIS